MSKKSEKLEQKLAALRDQIAAAQRAEREADKAELLRLIDRADCLTEAIAWATAKAGKRAGKQRTKQEAQ